MKKQKNNRDKNNRNSPNNKSTIDRISKKGLLFYIKNFFKGIQKSLRKLVYSDILADKRNRVVTLYALFIIVAAFVVRNITKNNSYSVYIDDKPSYAIAYSKDLTSESLTEQVVHNLRIKTGTNIKLNEKIELKKGHSRKKDIVKDMEKAVKEISDKFTYEIEATEILVAGNKIAIVKNDDVANSILNDIKKASISSEALTTNTEFVEEVRLEKKFVKETDLDEPDDVYSILTSEYESTDVYEVVSGDTLSHIEMKNNISRNDIIALNEGLTATTPLQIGQKLNIKTRTSVLSLKTFEDTKIINVVPFDTEERPNNTQGTKYKKIIQQGKNGEEEVTERVTKINGIEQSKEVIETKIIIEPVSEIVEIGTKS